jgi:hypothetical protein
MIDKIKFFFNRWHEKHYIIAPIPKTKQMLSQEKAWVAIFINKMNLEIYVPKK